MPGADARAKEGFENPLLSKETTGFCRQMTWRGFVSVSVLGKAMVFRKVTEIRPNVALAFV